jgi:DNA-binding phage protein
MTAAATNKEFVSLMDIALRMHAEGLPDEFVAAAVRAVDANEGVRTLMLLWSEAAAEERDAICADIQDLLDDLEAAPISRVPPAARPRISFDDFDDVLAGVKAHKQRLRDLIDKHGGVSEVARRSGIPQPSLSRMLNSGSMPRRATLYKIANALGLSEKDVVGEWVQ